MKAILLTLLILFICCKSFCQDLDVLKKRDTIYIVIDDVPTGNIKNYKNFSIQNTSNKFKKEFTMTDRLYSHIKVVISTVNNNPKNTVVVKRHKFLEKCKPYLIDYIWIEQHGLFNVFVKAIGKIKVVYMINSGDLNRKKIKLYKVQVVPIGFEQF